MEKYETNSLVSDLSIDDILASLSTDKKKVDEPVEKPSKIWSLDEIDKLIGVSSEPKTIEIEPKTIEIETAVKEQPVAPEVSDAFIDEALEASSFSNPAEKSEDARDNGESGGNYFSQKIKEVDSFISSLKNFEPEDDSEKIQPSETSGTGENSTDAEDEASYGGAVSAEERQLPDHINVQPIFNENIEHNINPQKIEKTPDSQKAGKLGNEKYRMRFLNRPVQNIEKTADYERLHLNTPDEAIETPGIIIKKSKFSNTADLEPLPTIVSAEYELKKSADMEKTMIADGIPITKKPEPEDSELAGQIKLSGFGDEPKADQIDEENAEEALRQKRLEKIKVFKLDTDFGGQRLPETAEPGTCAEPNDARDETEGVPFKRIKKRIQLSENYIDDEYRIPDDKSRILEALSKASVKSLFLSVAQAVLAIAALVISIVAKSSDGNLFGGSTANFLVFNIAVLLCSCGLSYKTISRGIKGIKTLRPNTASAASIVAVLCFLQCIVLFFYSQIAFSRFIVYAPVACFVFFMTALSNHIMFKRTSGNFEFCTNGTSLYSTKKIEDENDSFEIGRGLLLGEPDISYNARTVFPSDFLKNAFEDNPGDRINAKLVLYVSVGAVVISIITGIITKSFFEAFSALVAVCAIGLPAFSLLAFNLPLLTVNKKLNENGAMITGYSAIEENSSTNAIVIDSSDIFRGGGCNIYGIKTFHAMRIDEAILDTAALIIESGGPLCEIFENVILGRKELLPPVESLVYEDRLGLSAWIHGRRVLVGSRELLIHHNVEAPDKDFEAKYTHGGRKVIYLAVAGKISAMFVVKYQADDCIAKYLRSIENEGITLLIRTTDCNITEELICDYFKIPLSGVKIISSVAGDIFMKYSKSTVLKSPSQIIHNGTENAFLNSFMEALKLNRYIPISTTIQLIYSGVAVSLVAMLAFLSSISQIGSGQIVAFQALWAGIACCVPFFKKS